MKESNIGNAEFKNDFGKKTTCNLIIEVVKIIISERKGVLILPVSLEDAIKDILEFEDLTFELITKGIIERKGKNKKMFFCDKNGKPIMGYRFPRGVGVGSKIDADDWLVTLTKNFFITKEGKLLIIEGTEKSRYYQEIGVTERILNRVIAKNQNLSCWERNFLLEQLIFDIEVKDAFNQLKKEMAESLG